MSVCWNTVAGVGIHNPFDEDGPWVVLAKVPCAPTHIEMDVWLGHLLGRVGTGKIKLRINTWRNFQMPLLQLQPMLKQFEQEWAPTDVPIPWNKRLWLLWEIHAQKYTLPRRGGYPATQTLPQTHQLSNMKSETKADSQINPNKGKRVLHTSRASPTQEYSYTPEKKAPYL